MFHLKLIYKTRSKTLLLGTILLFLYTLVCTLGFKDAISWFYIKLFVIVFPVFYTGNVLSEEYEHNRSYIIFTTKTPIYVQGFTQFLSALGANCVMIFIMYISAYMAGLEHSLLGVFPLLAYTCFLSALAFTFSNLTRKNAVGFAVALLYWGLFFMAGTKANEMLMPLSTLININLQYDIVWYNVLSMLSFAIMLFLFNIWFIGKGEGIRKKITCVGMPTTLLLILLLVITPDTSYLTRTEWLTLSSGEVSMVYQDLPTHLENEFLTIWEATYESLIEITGKDAICNTLQISCETGLTHEPRVTDVAVTLNLLRSYFNDPELGGDFFHTSIPEAAFFTHFFGNFEDYYLAKGFSKYLTYTRTFEHLYSKDNHIINAKYFSYGDALQSERSYIDSLKRFLTATTFDYWASEEISGLILYTIDQQSPSALNEFLVDLSHMDTTITLEYIRLLAYKYADVSMIDEAIRAYQNATVIH